MNAVHEFRSFNRFFTREIGLLDKHLLASDYTLAEGRVLYELANNGEQTAADIGRSLHMDKAHLSRIVSRFEKRKLVRVRASSTHGRQRLITLTPAGQEVFSGLNLRSQLQMEQILAPLDDDARRRLVSSMRQIRNLIDAENHVPDTVTYRGLQPGDLGWVIHRQAVLYYQEYGLDWTYEALVAEILSKFVTNFNPEREAAWIAEYAGSIAGSIFLVQSEDPEVAKLRLLYVEPSARGLGIGRTLVASCVGRARELGYRQIKLWTNDVLVSARRIYEAAGFRLVDQEKHHSFGQDLVGQTWVLDLQA
ncbi:DNA-binding MarR family transcriptional regulator/GNAT superfamily N-acetyltransferase [Phyllobacterium trifolii]|uniref:DNA-binding MarR family transcriptional regulator/GNAT superfamily N-acetyltransferase n=1 Tax=Phyllobacterium trifolii TaxID=300193 RepID=A0A839UAC3_9HYPH|nr:bifunctional helix-turn-helix transcriptional regulator/GNAT family N-acetyltransferase [Phyllobacterium trifolii]MBB3145920.1 DNA-binding MarR family transcriptional regulator/GNAT superfamily N-acetyltransferase [Phyllobacterium trifolii]